MLAVSEVIKGYANQAAGRFKQAAGGLIDDPWLRASGKLQEAAGKRQKAIARAKAAVVEAVDKARAR